MNELNQPTTLDYKHVGGTEQIHFYLATANNDEYLVRVAANSEIIDSFNLTERPDAGEYFKQHYQINW